MRSALERALRLERLRRRARGGRPRGARHARRRAASTRSCSTWRCRSVDGLEVCRRLRAAGDRTPVLMLTARDAIDDRVDGLDAGADDYLVKPFALRELKARLRALLRRVESRTAPDAALRRPRARPARARGPPRRAPIELSRTEFSLLELFLEHPRQVLTRSQLFERVWGYDFGATLERARRLHRLPAAQDRGGRRAAAAAHGARRRLRPARTRDGPLRRRLTLLDRAAPSGSR